MQSEEQRIEDARLLARIATGEREAFTALVRRHGARFLRFARHLTRDDARAQDAVQEALLAIWSHRGALPEHALAWMLSAVRHSVYRQYRGARHAEREALDAAPLACAAGFGDDALQDRTLHRIEDRERIVLGLRALSEDDREILWLADAEGLNIDEQALALGVEVGAAKSRLHRARLRFIAALAKEDAHGNG